MVFSNLSRLNDELHIASVTGDMSQVNSLLECQQLDINAHFGRLEETALMEAAKKGHINVVEILLAHKQIDVNKKQIAGVSAYMAAAERGHTDIMRLFRGHGGVDVYTEGGSALILAASNGQTDAAKLLLEDEQIDVTQTLNFTNHGHNGHTALTVASKNGHYDIVELLLENENVDVNGRDGIDGGTALIHAAFNNQSNIVQLLLSQPDIDINMGNNDGDTPLMKAYDCWQCLDDYRQKTHENNYEILKLLLGHHNIDVNKQNNEGATALMEYTHYKKIEMMRLLLRNNEVDVNAVDYGSGSTALMHAIGANHGPNVGLLIKHEKLDVNKQNNNGWTALMQAAFSGKHIGSVLSHDQVDVNIRNNEGRTALFYAAKLHDQDNWDTGDTARKLEKAIKNAQLLLDHEDIEATMECDEAIVEEVKDLLCQHVSSRRKKRDANKLDL